MMPVAVPRARELFARVGVAVLALGVLVAYLPVIHALLGLWRTNPYYSYGLLIPAFAGYMIWESRKALAGPASWWVPGLGFTVIGSGILTIGAALDSLALRTLSLPLVLLGLGLFAFGRERFRPFTMPVVFLALMAPLPARTIAVVSPPLQDAAARFTAAALPLVGIPATRDGLYVHMPDVTLFVSEACNGLRFLLAMIVVGMAFAWLTQRGVVRRIAVFVAALVIAVLANWVRVAGTGVIAHVFGTAAASGTPHILYGKVVYAAMLVPFLLLVALLRRLSQ